MLSVFRLGINILIVIVLIRCFPQCFSSECNTTFLCHNVILLIIVILCVILPSAILPRVILPIVIPLLVIYLSAILLSFFCYVSFCRVLLY
jgi:hypothetical protein